MKSLRQRIIELLNSNSKALSLKDIYTQFPEIKNSTIRGRVYDAIGNGIERVGKGIYISSKHIIENGNTLKVIDRLIEQGDLFDFVFLDIPYKAGGQKGGNRDLFDLPYITPKEFGELLPKLELLLKEPTSPIIFMFTSGKSSEKTYRQFMAQFSKTNLIRSEKTGSYTKLWPNGNRMNMGKYLMPKELIHVFSKEDISNRVNNWKLDFENVPDKSYPTAKPYKMIKTLIQQATQIGDWILDPFAGSGKVLKAGIDLDRFTHNIDVNSDSIDNFLKPKLEPLQLSFW